MNNAISSGAVWEGDCIENIGDNCINGFYFSNNENWGLCISRFGALDDSYLDYSNQNDVFIIGVGANNNKSVNNMVENNTLPSIKDNS